MKPNILLLIFFNFLLCCFFYQAKGQAGEWVWIKGSKTQGALATYGTQGVSSPANNPPALYEPCQWTDLNGDFWLCGGYWTNGNSSTGYVYGDLWKYNVSTNQWTWMKGSGLPDNPGHYGTQGIPSPNNYPSGRLRGAASWTDNIGNLWMFGGDFLGSLNDLWRYNISTNEWTWMKGDSIPYQKGNYGVQGIPSIFNNPRCREEAATSWTDNQGNLWLFGGADFGFPGGTLNDLWKYDVSSNVWTWMKGDSIADQSGTYGIQGVEHPSYNPKARCVYSHWKDATGKLWIFGGFHKWGLLNDIWRYNPATNNWAWMGGDTISSSFGSYGTKCVYDSTNIPSPRFENRACWSDQFGNFWMFGGCNAVFSLDSVRNDLWMYCVATNKWIWVSGNKTFNPGGNWGTLGVSSPTNIPNGRAGSVGWTDNNGHLYLFGGARLGVTSYDMFNDIWKYTIDTACTNCNINVGIEETIISTDEVEVYPNPTAGELTIVIHSSDFKKAEIHLINLFGERVFISNGNNNDATHIKKININNLDNGIYILEVVLDGRRFVKKVAKH